MGGKNGQIKTTYMIYTTIYGKETKESGFQIGQLKDGDVIIRIQWDESDKMYKVQAYVCPEDNPPNFDRFISSPVSRFI
jgi:hypothetical protein